MNGGIFQPSTLTGRSARGDADLEDALGFVQRAFQSGNLLDFCAVERCVRLEQKKAV